MVEDLVFGTDAHIIHQNYDGTFGITDTLRRIKLFKYCSNRKESESSSKQFGWPVESLIDRHSVQGYRIYDAFAILSLTKNAS